MKRRFILTLAMLSLIGCATSRPPEYMVSHILCSTEAEAQLALTRLRSGEPFEKVATEMSQDSGTRPNGGRIARWTRADDFASPFASEVKRLKVNQVSGGPIKTEFGWHVVRVDAVR